MATTILVTGATGTIGTQVVNELAKRSDVVVRAGVRDPKKATGLPKGVEAVAIDYEKPDTLSAAMRGADKVFLLTPFSDRQVELGKRIVDAAKAAGVKHIVKLSAMGADVEPGIMLGRWHREVEKAIETSGIKWTFIRPNNFFENFLSYYPPDREGAIYLPWGNGACSFVDGRDVAACVATVLAAPGNEHENKAYVPTGPKAITIADAAKVIGEASGRSIKYVDVPEEAAKRAMLDMKLPAWMVDAMMELHGIDKAGYAAAVTNDVEKLTGNRARSFEEFARDNAAKWRG